MNQITVIVTHREVRRFADWTQALDYLSAHWQLTLFLNSLRQLLDAVWGEYD